MLDTTEKAYTIYHCDEIIDEVAYRLTRGNWYGYKQFHDHFACVVVSHMRIKDTARAAPQDGRCASI